MESSFWGISTREFFLLILLLLTGLLPMAFLFFLAEKNDAPVPKEQQYEMPTKKAVFAEQSTLTFNYCNINVQSLSS